jgi:hypothetical protein
VARGYHTATLPEQPEFDPWGVFFWEFFGSNEGREKDKVFRGEETQF